MTHRDLELPSTAWPCRLRHVPGQTVPELTFDYGPFLNGLSALQKAQYGVRIAKYKPPSDDSLYSVMFVEEVAEPTQEEVELKELYFKWADLHAATKKNLLDFENPSFQLPRGAQGHTQVTQLVRGLLASFTETETVEL